ncbi:MAG: 2-oxo acid dehydrogenase subunit E2 [candidate division Zixibacteria bacterium]|nr:2-oxo acid dehydrogenase subunit E2 [candidate division Zixibacteria bacterium]
MAVDVLVPQMGESVLEGTILEWKVKVGDPVKLNQPLVELMTDKVNVEIPAEAEGVLAHLFAKAGDVVPVGTRIAVIDDGKGDIETAMAEPAAAVEEPKAPPGAKVKASAAERPAEVKATAPVGGGKTSPKVKMLIRQYSLDPAAITPTGKDGLVTVADVMRSVESRAVKAGFTLGPIPPPPMPMPSISAAVPEERGEAEPKTRQPRVKVEIPTFEPLPELLRERRMPLAGVRKLIAEHMVRSIHTATHVTTFEDIDMTELVKYRRSIKQSFIDTYGVNITYMPFIIKAACTALKEFPTINASLTESEIILKNYYNIGVAVAREEGLIVPVIRDADKKTIVELAVELHQLGEKARTNTLTPDDVSAGTFSITNAGMFGATASTPIINQPQVAILGVHAIVKKPWVVDGQIVIRDISSFGMSFDHRLIDGHTAVQFLHRVHGYLADTNKLLLQLR